MMYKEIKGQSCIFPVRKWDFGNFLCINLEKTEGAIKNGQHRDTGNKNKCFPLKEELNIDFHGNHVVSVLFF
jgi:hypothetical protein